MIKGRGQTKSGEPLLLIGLSHENLSRLVADEPIVFDTGPLGLPAMKVAIMAGKTEAEIAEHFHVGMTVTPDLPATG
jgi:hypothetical protein